MSEEGKRERWYLAPLCWTVLFGVLFFRFWDHSVVFRDSFRLYAPYKFLIGKALGSGEVWAWNPWQYLGLPFVADIVAGWFYPLNLFYVFLPLELAHRLFILIHYPLAAWGMELWLKARGLSRPSRFLGGLGFALCGYLVSQHTNLAFLIGPALAPFALWAWSRSEKGWFSWALVCGAVLAVQVLGGEPQSAAVTGLLVVGFGFWRGWREGDWFREGKILSVILASSLLLCLVQVLPTYELLQGSVRQDRLSLTEVSFFSFHPLRVWEFLWPNPFGNLYPELTYWGQFTLEPSPTRIPYPWSICNYVGLPLIFLAGLGVRAGGKTRWGLLFGLLFFLAVSLGRHLPLFGWLYVLLPPLGYFRYPSKYLAWFCLFLALAGAMGLEELLRRKKENRGLRSLAGIYLGLTVFVVVAGAGLGPLVMRRLAGLTPGSVEWESAKAVWRESGVQFVAVNLAVSVVGFLWSQGILSSRPAGLAFFLILLGDLWLANVSSMVAGPREIFSSRPVLAQKISPPGPPELGRFRILREDFGLRDFGRGGAGLPELVRLSLWERETLMPNLDHLEGFENFLGYNQAVLRQGLKLLDRPQLKTLQVMNVGYVITASSRKPLSADEADLVFRDPHLGVCLYRLQNSFPRAYWVPAAIPAANDEQALKLFYQTDLSRAVILTTTAPLPASPASEKTMKPAKIVGYEPDEVVVEVVAEAAGWLVLSDRFYPGWRAEVDGEAVKLWRANLLVRAVPVPAGQHRVRFVFQPFSLRVGAVVSGLAWVSLLLFWFLRGFRHFLAPFRRPLPPA